MSTNNKSQFWSWSVLEKLSLDTLQGDVPKAGHIPDLLNRTELSEKNNEVKGSFPPQEVPEVPYNESMHNANQEVLCSQHEDSNADTSVSKPATAVLDDQKQTVEIESNSSPNKETILLKGLLSSAKLQIEEFREELLYKSQLLSDSEKSLNSTKKELKIKVRELHESTQSVNALRSTVSELERQNHSSKSQLAEVRIELVEKDERIGELEAQSLQAKQKISELSKLLAEAAPQPSNQDASGQFAEENVSLRRRIESLEKSLQLQRESSSSLSEQCKATQSELMRCSGMLRESSQKLDRVCVELASKESKVNELIKENAELSNLRDANDTKMRHVIEQHEAQLLQKSREITRLSDLLSTTEKSLKDAKEQSSNLELVAVQLRGRLENEGGAAQMQLDDYKKRAQSAIKDANTRAMDALQRLELAEVELLQVKDLAEKELGAERVQSSRLRSEVERLQGQLVRSAMEERLVCGAGIAVAANADTEATRPAFGEDVVLGEDKDNALMTAALQDTADAQPTTELFYVGELQAQLHALRKDIAVLTSETERYAKQLEEERAEKRRLMLSVHELTSFRNRALLGDDAAMNKEYLKTCVLRFMATSDTSEKNRLCPVIATLLDFTPTEKSAAMDALSSASPLFALGSALRKSMTGL